MIFLGIWGVGVEKSGRIAVSRGARLRDTCAPLHVYNFGLGNCKLWLMHDLALVRGCGWGISVAMTNDPGAPGTNAKWRRENGMAAAKARSREGGGKKMPHTEDTELTETRSDLCALCELCVRSICRRRACGDEEKKGREKAQEAWRGFASLTRNPKTCLTQRAQSSQRNTSNIGALCARPIFRLRSAQNLLRKQRNQRIVVQERRRPAAKRRWREDDASDERTQS